MDRDGISDREAPIFEVRAHWDAEAGVWWAESEAVPGLNAEAETMGELVADVREIAPELLALNLGIKASGGQIRIIADG